MTVRLNGPGSAAAHKLVTAGKVNKTGSWSFSNEDGNALLGDKGDDWNAYSEVHLGVDDAETDMTKAHWKYPVIKDGKVWRAGVIAAKSRAAAQEDGDVEDAAAELLAMIDKGSDKNSALPEGHERRFLGRCELRSAREALDDGASLPARMIGGYAARFNNPAVIGGYFREQIAPGAFQSAIETDDVRALFNHDNNFVLGRSSAKTLTLREDTDGLVWDCEAPETTWANDLLVSMKRGDICECSFQFAPVVEEWDFAGSLPMRTLREVKLYDVSAVTFPAYDDTSVALRSLERAAARGQVSLASLSTADHARLARKRSLLGRRLLSAV